MGVPPLSDGKGQEGARTCGLRLPLGHSWRSPGWRGSRGAPAAPTWLLTWRQERHLGRGRRAPTLGRGLGWEGPWAAGSRGFQRVTAAGGETPAETPRRVQGPPWTTAASHRLGPRTFVLFFNWKIDVHIAVLKIVPSEDFLINPVTSRRHHSICVETRPGRTDPGQGLLLRTEGVGPPRVSLRFPCLSHLVTGWRERPGPGWHVGASRAAGPGPHAPSGHRDPERAPLGAHTARRLLFLQAQPGRAWGADRGLPAGGGRGQDGRLGPQVAPVTHPPVPGRRKQPSPTR